MTADLSRPGVPGTSTRGGGRGSEAGERGVVGWRGGGGCRDPIQRVPTSIQRV